MTMDEEFEDLWKGMQILDKTDTLCFSYEKGIIVEPPKRFLKLDIN